MKERAPKPKIKLTNEEAKLQIINEANISFNQMVFVELEKLHPALATQLKPDFDEYVKAEIDMAAKHPKGDWSVDDLKKIIPNNLWFKYMIDLRSDVFSSEINSGELSDEELSKELEEAAEKRMKGEDIN
jgi:hypothetical protein